MFFLHNSLSWIFSPYFSFIRRSPFLIHSLSTFTVFCFFLLPLFPFHTLYFTFVFLLYLNVHTKGEGWGVKLSKKESDKIQMEGIRGIALILLSQTNQVLSVRRKWCTPSWTLLLFRFISIVLTCLNFFFYLLSALLVLQQ